MMRVRSDGALLSHADRPRPRHHRRRLRPRHRRRHRPREHPVPLDPDRGRARDLASGSSDAGLSTLEACGDSPRPFLGSPVAGVAADEIIDGTSALEEIQRRDARQPGRTPTCRASSRPPLTGHPSHDVSPETNDVVVRRHRPPRARPRLRPLGRRRAVHQPDARPEGRRLDPARRGRRRLGGRGLDLPRLRLPPAALAGPAEVPGRRLGHRRSSARCSRTSTSAARWSPASPPPRRSGTATTSACTRSRTAGCTSGSPRPSAGSPAPCWSSSPT